MSEISFSEASSSLLPIPAADLDGKFIRIRIAGIAGSSTVKLYLNGTQFFNFGVSGVGVTFIWEGIVTWNSTNKDFAAQSWVSGSPTNLSSINPTDFTFSTDSVHTITSFGFSAV